MNINEIMTIEVKTCKVNTSLESVAALMWKNDCGAIPVVDNNNKPLGVITDRDITMAAMLNRKPLWSLFPADLISNQELCCCEQNDSIQDCLAKMQAYAVRRIVVTNADGTLAGIASIGDIVAFTSNSHTNFVKALDQLKMEPVLGLLKRVSAHHMVPERPMVMSNSSNKENII